MEVIKLLNTKTNDEYKKINIDNKWIFPYFLLISKTIKEYINVELCSLAVAMVLRNLYPPKLYNTTRLGGNL